MFTDKEKKQLILDHLKMLLLWGILTLLGIVEIVTQKGVSISSENLGGITSVFFNVFNFIFSIFGQKIGQVLSYILIFPIKIALLLSAAYGVYLWFGFYSDIKKDIERF